MTETDHKKFDSIAQSLKRNRDKLVKDYYRLRTLKNKVISRKEKDENTLKDIQEMLIELDIIFDIFDRLC